MTEKLNLLKPLENAIKEFNAEISRDFRGRVSIYPLEYKSEFSCEAKSYGVNWSACGTQAPAEAAKMADYIQRAVGICNGINELLKEE